MPETHNNHSVIASLEAQDLWQAFASIANIPHCSKHEEAIRDFIRDKAVKLGHQTVQDYSGNLLVSIKASPGFEKCKGITIQSHVDMVCEKNQDTCHDFLVDALQLRIDGDWLLANGTTLGADNGIGVAMMIALMSCSKPSQAIDLLFTIDEETGLTGALNLDTTMLRFDSLINLDGEEEGIFYIGCAGGSDTNAFLKVDRNTRHIKQELYQIKVSGLEGGHSGADIHLKRANAIKLIGAVLQELDKEKVNFKLYSIDGGDKHNAIPREAFAKLGIEVSDFLQLNTAFEKIQKQLLDEWRLHEARIELSLTKIEQTFAAPISQTNRNQVLSLIAEIPHGVLSMSSEIANLVSTSNNLASIKTNEETIQINTSHRSDKQEALVSLQNKVKTISIQHGAEIQSNNGYPAWTPQSENTLVASAKAAHSAYFKTDAQITAIHAGLECGVIGSKKPALKMISFGPTIRGAHTPEEKVSIASTERVYSFLVYLIEYLAKSEIS